MERSSWHLVINQVETQFRRVPAYTVPRSFAQERTFSVIQEHKNNHNAPHIFPE